jgi:hypothetical protein
MSKLILTLREDLERKYVDITFQGTKWLGRHVANGSTEELPIGAFILSPIETLIPDLDKAIAEALAKGMEGLKQSLATEVAEVLIVELEKTGSLEVPEQAQ